MVQKAIHGPFESGPGLVILEIGADPVDGIGDGVAVFVLLDDAGIVVPDEQEDEVERFREFLDHVSPEDFDEGQA